MSAAWKIIIAIIIIIGVYFGYSQLNKEVGSVDGTQSSTQTDSNNSVPGNASSTGNTKPSQKNTAKNNSGDEDDNFQELQELAQQEEDKKKVEEIIELNEETGELVIRDAATNEIVFETIIDKELIPLTKQSLELEMPADLPEEAFSEDELTPSKPPAVSVFPPESSGQVPEQVIIQDGENVEVIDVPQDAKDLKFVSSIPGDETASDNDRDND